VYCTVLTNTAMIKASDRLQVSEIKYCFQVLVTCIQVLASKLSTNAKFQYLQDLNSRTFQGFSSTFKHLICFQALSRALKFSFQIQAFSRISQARYEPWKVLITKHTVIDKKNSHLKPDMDALHDVWPGINKWDMLYSPAARMDGAIHLYKHAISIPFNKLTHMWGDWAL